MLAIPFGLAIGLSLGLVGAGGSILAVPVLVYVLGEDVQAATTASLVVVGVASLAGSLDHAREGRVRWRAALGFGLAGAPGALAGTALNRVVSSEGLLLAFALLLLVAAAAMLSDRSVGSREERPSGIDSLWPRAVPAGFAVGGLTGFFGVGGGFLVVPALVLLFGLPMTVAVGTSLLVVAMLSGVAFVAHLTTGGVDWALTSLFTAAALAGVLLGSRLSGRLPDRRLTQGLAVVLAAVAVYLLVVNVPAIA